MVLVHSQQSLPLLTSVIDCWDVNIAPQILQTFHQYGFFEWQLNLCSVSGTLQLVNKNKKKKHKWVIIITRGSSCPPYYSETLSRPLDNEDESEWFCPIFSIFYQMFSSGTLWIPILRVETFIGRWNSIYTPIWQIDHLQTLSLWKQAQRAQKILELPLELQYNIASFLFSMTKNIC